MTEEFTIRSAAKAMLVCAISGLIWPLSTAIVLAEKQPSSNATQMHKSNLDDKNAIKTANIVTSSVVNIADNVTTESLKAGLNALYAQQAEQAITIRNGMPKDSLDRHILTWAIGVSGVKGIPSFEITAAMQELKNWPGAKVMRRNFERALVNEANTPQTIINGFGNNTPITTQGMAALCEALIKSGQTKKAHEIIAPWWHTTKLNDQDEQLVLNKAGVALFPEDHMQRLRFMLYANRMSSAGRVAKLANAQSLFYAFSAFASN